MENNKILEIYDSAYKNLSCVLDKKACLEDHPLASLVLPSDDEQ